MHDSPQDYEYATSKASHTHTYLWENLLRRLKGNLDPNATIFDMGCGNGSTAGFLAREGFIVEGIDPSKSGIERANSSFPELRLEQGTCYDDLSRFGLFDAVISLEVVEHVELPRKFATAAYALLKPGGVAIISTPYHGYLKNLALAATGKMDQHFTALWDGGHIKFWSIKTLTALLKEPGFRNLEFDRIGRIPPLAKSMMVLARK